MNELDKFWSEKLDEAISRAQSDGRSDVAEYLTLKATNDAVRQAGVQWLFGAMIEIAGRNPLVEMETETPHRFAFGAATMVGALLRLRHGVRSMTIEAGWTRTPADGFMRGGALAAARITHFGMTRHNAELILVRAGDRHGWFAVDREGDRSAFDLNSLTGHFQVFSG